MAKKTARAASRRSASSYHAVMIELTPKQIAWLDVHARSLGVSRSHLIRLVFDGCIASDQLMETPGAQRMLTDLVTAAVQAAAAAAAREMLPADGPRPSRARRSVKKQSNASRAPR